MKSRIFFILFSLIFVISIYSECLAEDFWKIDREDLKGWVIGLGASYSTGAYIGADDDVYPVPLIVGQYKKFYIDGKFFGVILNDDENLKVSIVGFPRFMGYDDKDSTQLNGMDDRDASLDGGLRLAWDNEYFSLHITGLSDLLNNHQGQEVRLALSKKLLKGFLTPRVGVKWQGKDLVDYYYGVLGNEARATRPGYEGSDTVNYTAGVRMAIPLGDEWAFVFDFEYENFGSEISDSPIVDTDKDVTYVIGAVYRF